MNTIISDLQDPGSLPDRTENVSVLQTHISVVFVADFFVYKIKKPVDFGFLDFSTLEKRKYYCEQEVKLNRRLSRGVYLDVLPVLYDGTRHSLKGGEGEAVEYAVKMKRIPDEVLMKSLFYVRALTEGHLKTVADRLAAFHLQAERSPEIDVFGEAVKFKINTDENFEQVQKYIDMTIGQNEFESIREWTDRFYETNEDLFSSRITEGRIRDCHGDLHMEHICFTDDLAVIDCIEFNERFRYSDTVADIAFLLMDLEFHGGRQESEILWNMYKNAAGEEQDVDSLLTFYKIYRAFVRGKVNSFQVDDDAISPDRKNEAVRTARKYFQLAYSYVEGNNP